MKTVSLWLAFVNYALGFTFLGTGHYWYAGAAISVALVFHLSASDGGKR